MTNPIPEVAVEAASAALRRTEAWGRLAAYSRMSVKDARSIRDELVTAALTAARPHMEAEIRGQVAAEIRAVANDPDRSRPRRIGAEHATDLANDFEWCAQIASAIIAERTHDEPA